MGWLYVWRVCGNVCTGALCSNGGVRRTWNDGISDVYFNGGFFCYLCGGLDLAKLELRHTLKRREIYHKCITVPAVFVCLVLCLVFRGNLKDSLFYSSCSYIASGQAADFKEQMESQERILRDDSIKEAYLCPTNPEQGPLMHMPVIKNPEAFTNRVVGNFYGKDMVTTTE